MRFQEYLRTISAGEAAITWIGDKEARQAWVECDQPEWLLWLAQHCVADSQHQRVIGLGLELARMVPPSDHADSSTLDSLDHWLLGERVNLDDLALHAAGISANAARKAEIAWVKARDAALKDAKSRGIEPLVLEEKDTLWAVKAVARYAARSQLYAVNAAKTSARQAAYESSWIVRTVLNPRRITRTKTVSIELCEIIRKHLPWSVIGPNIEEALSP